MVEVVQLSAQFARESCTSPWRALTDICGVDAKLKTAFCGWSQHEKPNRTGVNFGVALPAWNGGWRARDAWAVAFCGLPLGTTCFHGDVLAGRPKADGAKEAGRSWDAADCQSALPSDLRDHGDSAA